VIALALLGACSGGGSGATTWTITAPTGLGQLVPGGTLAIGWTVSGTFTPADVDVSLASREGGSGYALIMGGTGNATLSANGFTWDGSVIANGPVAPGYYDLVVSMGGAAMDAGDTHVVVAQGLTFTTPALGGAVLHASQAAPASLMFDTATIGTLDVTIFAAQGATKTPIHMSTVPGELHSVSRQLTWDGTDSTGAALAAGSYTLGATITDQASGLTYTASGGDVVIP
jgi:hypothetical protein